MKSVLSRQEQQTLEVVNTAEQMSKTAPKVGKEVFDKGLAAGMRKELAAFNREHGTNIQMDDVVDRLEQLKSVQQAESDQSQMEVQELVEGIEELQKEAKQTNKILTSKTGNGLNSNVIKLFNEIKKVTKPISRESAADLTQKSLQQPVIQTPKDVMKSWAKGLKPDLSMKGIMTKVGLAGEGGGLLKSLGNAAIATREAKAQYREDYKRVNTGELAQFKNNPKKLDAYLNQKWSDTNKLRAEQAKTQGDIEGMRSRGWSEKEIGRTGLMSQQQSQATQMAKLDQRFRPEGFNRKTGLVTTEEVAQPSKAKPSQEAVQSSKAKPSQEAVQSLSTNSPSSDDVNVSEEESESIRMQATQLEVVKQIEINTRPLDPVEKEESKEEKKDESSLLGTLFKTLMGSLMTKLGTLFTPMLAALKSLAGGAVKTAAKAAASVAGKAKSMLPAAGRALGTAARFAGPAAAVAAAGYAGYQAGTYLNEKFDLSGKIADKAMDWFGPEVPELNPTPVKKPKAAPKAAPARGADAVYKKSAENKAESKKAAPAAAPVVVNAPTNISKPTTNLLSKPAARNGESSASRYISSRYSPA